MEGSNKYPGIPQEKGNLKEATSGQPQPSTSRVKTGPEGAIEGT